MSQAQDKIIDDLNRSLSICKEKKDNQTQMLNQFAKEAVEKDELIETLRDTDKCSCVGWVIFSFGMVVYVIVDKALNYYSTH